MRERSLGIKIPPTNLKPDFGDQAQAFANKLADNGLAPAGEGLLRPWVYVIFVIVLPAIGRTHDFMRWHRLAFLGLLAALSVGATACGKSSSSTNSAAATASTTSSSAALPIAKRGVVTIPMATVGDPGNPSVGVWQVFKTVGTSGASVTLPPNNSPGIYKNCGDAPSSAPSCLTVGAVEDTYGIGEFEITVSQYVTFLNTVDPDGKNLRQLYEDNMNSKVWPQYGPINYSSGSEAASGKHYSVAYPEWAQKPFNFGDFRRGARFVNSLFNGKVLSKTSSTSGAFKYVTYKVRLSPRTEKGMYDMTTRDADANRVDGVRPPEQRRVGQGRLLRPEARRDRLLLALSDRPLRPAEHLEVGSRHGRCHQRGQPAAGDLQPERPEQQRGHSGCAGRSGPDLVPVAGRAELRQRLPAELPTGTRPREALHGEREHGRPGEDSFPLGCL